MIGTVSLVGAGPGDPELLTLKGLDRLQHADLVLYDALIPTALLERAPLARRLFVGKRAGTRSISQQTIQRLMIRAARRGERVVRLKGGDPFVLGRGGEEALALAAAGVPYEVIPGVSAAIAAPAAAGIPLTHRGICSGFVVISGHAEASVQQTLTNIAPNALTVVVLMGLALRARIAALLLESGWAVDTPAAVVLGATTPEVATWFGTLEQLGGAPVETIAPGLPGSVVVGEVVRLAGAITTLDPAVTGLAKAETCNRAAGFGR